MAVSKNQRAVLTGAAGGIGREIAKALMAQCAQLILVGRNRAALEALRSQLDADKVHIVDGDLTQSATLERIVRIGDTLGGIDLLVNNAGNNDFHAFETQSPDVIRSMMEINLIAPMLLSRALIPLLKRASRAQIVNIGSVMGGIGFPGYAAYCASKSGLYGFSQALRRELADTTIDVRYFAPRATRTAINGDAAVAMNRELKTAEDAPEDVAHAFVDFLNGRARERTLGGKESFFVFVNRIFPGLPERAIRNQLGI
ncbi:MAG TPA: SDR family oxidoreductase, partial [Oxalicibacterium sp.]|nr:SDR family oxidoreductase [Oxalicibacterium sp.]